MPEPHLLLGVVGHCSSIGNLVLMQAFNMERQYEEFQVAMHGLMTRIAYPWKFVVKKLRAKEFLAEFLGTFILCVSKLFLVQTNEPGGSLLR